MLVSRNVFHVVSALQSIVFKIERGFYSIRKGRFSFKQGTGLLMTEGSKVGNLKIMEEILITHLLIDYWAPSKSFLGGTHFPHEKNSPSLIKMHMTWKIFSAYLKGLSNTEEWRLSFFVLEILTFSFMQIRPVMTSYCLQLKMVKYWINDISGNIEAVFLKLGTINVHHKRNKMTPSMVLP